MRNSTRVFNSAGKKGRKRTEVAAPEDQVAPITASQKRPPEEELRKVGTAHHSSGVGDSAVTLCPPPRTPRHSIEEAYAVLSQSCLHLYQRTATCHRACKADVVTFDEEFTRRLDAYTYVYQRQNEAKEQATKAKSCSDTT